MRTIENMRANAVLPVTWQAEGTRGNVWAKFAGLSNDHDTMDGNSVQVRLYVNDPTRITKDTFASGHVKGSEVDKVKSHFEKWFRNKLRVIHLDQQGVGNKNYEIHAPPLKLGRRVYQPLCYTL